MIHSYDALIHPSIFPSILSHSHDSLSDLIQVEIVSLQYPGRYFPQHTPMDWGCPHYRFLPRPCLIPAMLFSIVNEIYEYYEARSAISIFRMNKLFSHHFWYSKLEIFDSHNVRKPILFPDLSNEYVLIFLTSM